jgi:hypothetical protein
MPWSAIASPAHPAVTSLATSMLAANRMTALGDPETGPPFPGLRTTRQGWGCLVCGLPPDGAYAVLCDTCKDGCFTNQVTLQFVCRGWPVEDGRIPFGELSAEPFDHDMMKHAEGNERPVEN